MCQKKTQSNLIFKVTINHTIVYQVEVIISTTEDLFLLKENWMEAFSMKQTTIVLQMFIKR